VYESATPADHSFEPREVPVFAGTWPLKNLTRSTVTAQGHALILSTTPLATESGRYLIELGTSLESIETLQQRLLIARWGRGVTFACCFHACRSP
jgi:hypothetical protein